MSKQYCCMCRAVTSNTVFHVPKDPKKRKLWAKSAGQELVDNNKVCDKHFDETDSYYVSENAKRRRLLPSAVPKKLQPSESKSIYTEHHPSHYSSNAFDFNSQTEKEVVEAGIALDNLRLKLKIAELQKENAILTQRLQEYDNLANCLKSIFTPTQIKKLQNGGKRIKWCNEDISYAICLHATGPRSYRHLYEKGFPIPCESTLDKWLKAVEVKPGPLNFVLSLMKNSIDLDEHDKICALTFDQIKNICSQEAKQPPRQNVQVAMVQGLRKSWQQVIYFDYDNPMSTTTLFALIEKLYAAGYHVVAIVSDLSPDNQKLWTSLGISPEKTWFEHPANKDLKVFTFADVPHLINLIRNYFLDTGLVINGTTLTQQSVKQAMKHASASDFSIHWKVTEDHLTVREKGRQKVKLATQLLSTSTAKAIRRCHPLGLEVDNACETADFIQLANDWFDIFNVKGPTVNSTPTKHPFGQNLVEQRRILQKMTTIMSSSIIPNGNERLPFQNGIIVSNISLDLMLQYLREKYKMDSLITNRILQDQIKDFFVSMHNIHHDNQSPSEFKFQLHKYLLARMQTGSMPKILSSEPNHESNEELNRT